MTDAASLCSAAAAADRRSLSAQLRSGHSILFLSYQHLMDQFAQMWSEKNGWAASPLHTSVWMCLTVSKHHRLTAQRSEVIPEPTNDNGNDG